LKAISGAISSFQKAAVKTLDLEGVLRILVLLDLKGKLPNKIVCGD